MKRICKPTLLGDLLVQMALDKNDPMSELLLQMPCIQEAIKEKEQENPTSHESNNKSR